MFSFTCLSSSDPVIGIEIVSTGEVACFGASKEEAFLKALLLTGFKMFKKNILVLVQGELQDSFTHSVWALHELGYQLFAMPQSANVLEKNKGPCPCVAYATDTKSDLPLCIDINKNDEIGLVINVPMHKSTKS